MKQNVVKEEFKKRNVPFPEFEEMIMGLSLTNSREPALPFLILVEDKHFHFLGIQDTFLIHRILFLTLNLSIDRSYTLNH